MKSSGKVVEISEEFLTIHPCISTILSDRFGFDI